MNQTATGPTATGQAAPDAPAAALASVDPEARAHIHRVVGESKTSFLWAMKLLEKPRREAMFAIYAFCREIDDIADEPAPTDDKIARLAAWRAEIDRLCDGRPESPTARGLAPFVALYGLRREDFLALIDGMETDARAAIHGPTLAELELYCDRVASAVGRLSVRAFGDHGPAAVEVARHLGQALQLTNILRDIAEDAGRDRLYLPAELLDRHGIDHRDPARLLDDPALPAVCADLAAIARDHFARARAALDRSDRRAMRPAIVMLEIYRRLLDRLEKSAWRDPRRRVSLSTLEKLLVALRCRLPGG